MRVCVSTIFKSVSDDAALGYTTLRPQLQKREAPSDLNDVEKKLAGH